MSQIRENWQAYGRFLRDMHQEAQEWAVLREKWDKLYLDILRTLAPYSYCYRLRLYLFLTTQPLKRLWRRMGLATNW